MCMTAEAFALFLNILSLDAIDRAPGEIIIHAEEADAVWIVVDDLWCTAAPQIDRMARLGKGE